MKTAITGGAGFLGSNLADRLVDAGDEVLVLDDLSTGREHNLRDALEAGLQLAVGDVSEPDFLAESISSFAPDRIFHLAAQADVRKSNDDPGFDARVNVIGTINVLEAARRGGGLPVVFAATGGAAYGEGSGSELPLPEATEPAPESAYGVGKLAGEGYVDLYRRMYDVPGLALRFGNIYGPRQDPHGEAGVVAIFCGRLLDGVAPTIFGDGLQTRDYVYVDDAVRALVAASDAQANRGAEIAGPFNVGTGVETTVLDLLEILAPLSGADPEPVFAGARQGEVQRIAIDPRLAGRELGWQPLTDLEAGLQQTLASVRRSRSA